MADPTAQLTTLHLPDGTAFEGHVARPASDQGDLPGVLLFMDAIGLRPQIAAMADRIATWGYVVLAPNVYHRYGSASETSPSGPITTQQQREEWFASLQPRLKGLFAADVRDQLLADLRGYAAALHALPGVGPGPIGATGYCMGARLAMLLAGELGDGVAAVGGFHGGGLVTDDPLSPHRALPGARAEFWFGHAANDRSNTPEQQAALDAELTRLGLRHGAQEYQGAPHGYTMADMPTYQEAAAEQHFTDLRALLARTLGCPAT